MKKVIDAAINAHVRRGAFYVVVPLAVTLLALFRLAAQPTASQRTLTFAERVAYQRAIEEVYWRHRIWPKENAGAKPPLDKVMPQAQIEKKVEDYLRDSQALEDYWQRPITPDQLQAEMERIASHTKQPGVLREIFAALGNDPFVIAECLARPALAERLLTNWYAYNQRIHGELKQRVEAELQAHNTVEQMKLTSGKYSEIELLESDGTQDENNPAHKHAVELNASEWNETVQKLAAIFDRTAVAAGVLPVKSAPITEIKTGVLSPLQEDDGRYYAMAVIEKTEEHLKLATVAWPKEPLEFWIARAESQVPTAIGVPSASYTLPKISDEGGCIDDTWTATSGPPDPREFHTAVWTGSEMIVWGGNPGDCCHVFSTGGRFNPSTDSWTATSTINAPTDREYHTAVWTGTEMIVWGGTDGVNYFNTGGRYNPTTNSWTATSTSNVQSGRSSHTAVWTGNEMIIWGGFSGYPNYTYFNNGGRYNPNTDSWTVTDSTNAPAGRYEHTAVWTSTEMIVWGGSSNLGRFNTGGRYDPSTNSWTATTTIGAPASREAHTAVWTGSQMIIWGGNGDLGDLNSGGKYNPGTNSWTATSTTNAPSAREFHTAVWTGNQMIIWGGSNNLNTGGKYNPTTDIWTATSTTNAPTGRWRHAAVWAGSEMIVWGGRDASSPSNSGGRYNPSANIWTPTGANNAPSARAVHTALWTGSEMIVWGGYDAVSYLGTGSRYNATTDSWMATTMTNAPSAREFHTTIWNGSEMIVWGGFSPVGGYENTGGRYNPGTNSWAATSTTNAPTGRYQHTAVWIGTQMIVWGGVNNTTYLNTGGRYTPGTDNWTAMSTTNAPDARTAPAVWTGSEMIVWGGFAGGFFDTGGRYNPNTNSWGATSIINAPDARYDHTAVWTGNEMIIWGGTNGADRFNTGGRYNPGTGGWTATSTTNAPSARNSHTAVWSGSQMIVWGGFGDGSSLNTGGRYYPGLDIWITTSTIGAPASRSNHSAVWAGLEMIVWGGNSFVSTFTNTGGRYCAQSGSPTPTPTATASPTPTPTATASPTPTPTASPTPTATPQVLYDQYNNTGTLATVSATFTDSPSHNADLADDFVVPGGQTWHVQSIDADGIYFNGSGPANSFSVFFYINSGGFPGTQVYSATNRPWTQNGTTFTVNLTGTAVLTAGTYWVEIQANMTFSTGGEWGWTGRTVTANNAARWQNPAGGFGPPPSCPAPGCPMPCPTCITWGIRQCCTGSPAGEPDQMFRLIGSIGGPTPTPTATRTPTPTASPTPTPTPTPCTGRCSPTPRPRPTSAGRPSPPPRLTPPPAASPSVTSAPRPTPPPRLTPPPTPTGSPRPTPAPRP